jgi:glycosyltransferase involved in cell wall biosynthesis
LIVHRYLQIIHHWQTLLAFIASGKRQSRDDKGALRAACEWLIHAQEPSGGYRHSYHLLYGWQPAYPETTGYIIPTLLQARARLGDDRLGQSAKKAFQWLQSIQAADGSFPDLQGKPQVFDTGQILIGLNYIAEHHPDWPSVEDSQRRAAGWLMKGQESDGSFIHFAYNHRPHTYYSRVGAAMIKAGILLKDDNIREAGLRHIDWVLAQQDPVGFFGFSSFDDNPPFLHTLVYILEGLLDAHALTGRQDMLDAVIYNAGHLLNSKSESDILRSQYYDDFTIANPHICTTGLAQWAGVCFRLSTLLNNLHYRKEGERSLRHVVTHQVISRDANINGGLTGSLPVTGNYLRMAFPNWGMKFFIDALMAQQKSRRRVVFSLPGLEAGGAERVMINLMNGLDQECFDASLLTVRSGPLRANIRADIAVDDLKRTSVPLSLPELYRTLRRIRPDIIVSTMTHMNFAVLLLKPFFPATKFIIREAITPSFFLQKGDLRAHIVGMLYKFLYPKSDVTLAPAKLILREFKNLGLSLKLPLWLPNPVDEAALRNYPVAEMGKGVRFVAAGRLHHQKGFDRLIVALKDFSPTDDWTLTILGEGSERENLERLVAESNLKDHVILAGHKVEPWAYYAAADAFILPSRWEGLPNVALEALACGTPVLALREAGGIHEMAECANGAVQVFDGMESLTEAMSRIKPGQKRDAAPSLLPPRFSKEAVDGQFCCLLNEIIGR